MLRRASARRDWSADVMLPPTSVCSPAPIVPKIDRERTVIPRTTPSVRTTRKPSSSNCVVTMLCGTIRARGYSIVAHRSSGKSSVAEQRFILIQRRSQILQRQHPSSRAAHSACSRPGSPQRSCWSTPGGLIHRGLVPFPATRAHIAANHKSNSSATRLSDLT